MLNVCAATQLAALVIELIVTLRPVPVQIWELLAGKTQTSCGWNAEDKVTFNDCDPPNTKLPDVVVHAC